MTFPNRRFGVEIECVGLYEDKIDELFRKNKIRGWYTTDDCSLRPNQGMRYGQSAEVVSPPLRGKAGLKTLVKVVNMLKEAGAQVNRSCGLHVHLDAADLSAGEILTIVRRYAAAEKDINKWMDKSRNGNTFCRSVRPFAKKLTFEAYELGMDEVIENYDRYHKVNLASYVRHGTIEFRHHHGSVDSKEIVNWVKFLLYFTAQVKKDVATLTPTHRFSPAELSIRKAILEVLGPIDRHNQRIKLSKLREATGASQKEIEKLLFNIDGIDVHRTNGSDKEYTVYRYWACNEVKNNFLGLSSTYPRLEVNYAVATGDVSVFRGIPRSIANYYSSKAMSA